MKTLVIPENPTLDQYILKPVVERIFEELKKPAKVIVLQDPHLNGVDQALDLATLEEILLRYPMVDLFLLIVDRDCDEHRQLGPLTAREEQARALGRPLIGCLAIEEVEVWALALHHKSAAGRWNDLRSECHPKEVFFEPFVQKMGWQTSLGRGRVRAMKSLPGKWKTLKSRCPEVRQLIERIREWAETLDQG